MKQTILTTNQSRLLENLIAKHGHVVTTEQIYKAALSWTQKETKNVITKLTKSGWLIRIKRGLYAISDFSNRGFLSLSPYVVANLLVNESYVSFESALAYRGMFDQMTDKIISISKMQYKSVHLNAITYSFVNVKDDSFLGFEEVTIDGQRAQVATAEKALIDMVQFHRSKYTVDLVIEKIREYQSNLSLEAFYSYLTNSSLVTVKIFGFIFDLLNIDSERLLEFLENKQTTNVMLTGDKKFNSKWRLYYDEYFDKYQKS